MITLTINGKEVSLEKPQTVLEAARSAGIKIPTLCYHELLEKYGGCRLCLVEVEKMPRLQTACTLMAADGMVVRTETEQLAEIRRGILEFLLINHPLDCPFCDKAGECELQDLVEKYGPGRGRFSEKKRKVPESLEDPVIVRNMERCVVCTRCVRMCEGVQGAAAIGVMNRGGHSSVEPFSAGRYDCEYCGNCLSVCPVGAIMSRLHRHSYRPWQIQDRVETICPFCGVGCTVVLQTRDDVIKRVIPKVGSAVNNGMLCSRGRFGYEFANSPSRLTAPLVKKNGVLEETSWEEAIGHVAKRLGEIKASAGGQAIAGIASPRCTNEDNYIFQKFMRVVLGTNSIDSAARLGYAGAQSFLENIFGQGSTSNIISGLSFADAVLVVGGDPTTVNPILGLQVRAAARNGARVLTLGNYKGLVKFSPVVLSPVPGTEATVLEGIVTALIEKKGLPGTNSVLEAAIKEVRTSAGDAKKSSGIGDREFDEVADALAQASTPAIVIGKDLIQSTGSSYKLLLLAAIYYLVNAKIYLLSDRPNEQGLLDAGCSPDMLPGYRAVTMAEFRKRYNSTWQTELPDVPGLSLFEMIDSARKGSLKALYVMGENPVFNFPDSSGVTTALETLDFLVVQDIFLTETGRLADVVLPSASWAEKDGTFTNLERRVQRLRKSIQRSGMEDWKILVELASKMGQNWTYAGAEDIFRELGRVSPLYRDLSYDDIDGGESVWPYKGEPLRDLLEHIEVDKGTAVSPDGKLFCRIERPLFHSGTLSRRSPALVRIYAEPVARISPATAEKHGVKTGDWVRVSSAKGTVELPVAVDDMVEDFCVVLTNHFEKKGAFALVDYRLDPVLGTPCMDTSELRIERFEKQPAEVTE